MRINYVLDCADPDALAGFWAAALGFERGAWRPPSPYVSLTRPGAEQPEMLLQQVPEPKQAKNRMHLDLRVADSETEVARLVALGATVLADHRTQGGEGWVVLTDPAGNEFCLVRSESERHP